MATEKSDKKNGKMSLYPLKFEEAVKDLLKTKPIGNSKSDNKSPTS